MSLFSVYFLGPSVFSGILDNTFNNILEDENQQEQQEQQQRNVAHPA